MKKNTLLALASGTLFSVLVLTLFSFKQTGETPSYITMTTYEYAAVNDSRIVIVYENGTTEEIALEHTNKVKTVFANDRKILETLNMVNQKGYRLVTAVSKSPSQCSYIFERK